MKISGLELATNKSILFQAGTKKQGEDVLTNGGRVLAVTSLAKTREQSLQMSMEIADQVHFEGKYFRRDIGFDLK